MNEFEIKIKELIRKGELTEALDKLEKIEKDTTRSEEEFFKSQVLKSRIHCNKGEFEESCKLAQTIFEKYQALGDPIQSLEALLIQEEAL